MSDDVTTNEDQKTEQNNQNKDNRSKKAKKKKNPVVRILMALLYVLIGLIAAIGIWIGICTFDKKSPIDMFPENFTAYLHTDSIFESINPMLDLQAADIYLSTEDMSDIRGLFMMFRESEYRDNKYIKYLANRKVDAAFYSPNGSPDTFIATIDLGVFSAVSRLANIFVPMLSIDGVSHIQQNGIDFFKYINGSNVFFIKPVKNLLVISNNFDYFVNSLNANHESSYSKESIQLLKKQTKDPIRLVVDSKSLAQSFTKENPVFYKLSSMLSDRTLSSVSINLTDAEINLSIEIPVELTDSIRNDRQLAGLSKIMQRNSTQPDVVSRLSSAVQYYTVLNTGSLKDLLETTVALNSSEEESTDKKQKSKKEEKTILDTADSLSQSLFKLSLDELLYSWTAEEFGVIGIEGLNDPVFAVKISNEEKRREVFTKLTKSILISENKSLILNGVRIPRLGLPDFLQNLLKLFKMEIPRPYYLVYNNYIYFSQSAEAISTIYSTFSNGTNISFNKNWTAVSEKAPAESAISLFYDLERTRPFFITSNSALSQIIELYTVGRADFSIKGSTLTFSLNAISKRAGSLRNIPGFPIDINGKSDFIVRTCDVNKPETIVWLENNQTIKAMDVMKTQIYSYELPSKAVIQTSHVKQDEKILALTNQNQLYMFNNKLELEKGYPVRLPEPSINQPYLSAETSFIPVASGKFMSVTDRKVSTVNFGLDSFEDVNLLAHYNGQSGILYERSFLGKIFVLYKGKCINKNDPIIVDKIGFGLPACTDEINYVYQIGFISQSGDLSIWEVNGDFIDEKYTLKLDGVFFNNVVACGKYFFALSDKAELFRIDAQDGSVLSIQIDNATAKEGMLAVVNSNKTSYICVGIDGNQSYAFNSGLELISGFPVPARGIPGFADVNGDSFQDCFALTLDGKLNAWNLR